MTTMLAQASRFIRRAARSVDRRIKTRLATSQLYTDAKALRPDRRAAVVVAMPNAIHLAEAALRKLYGGIDCVCVLNGVPRDEANRLREQFPDAGFIAIHIALNHHLVIEPLVRTWDAPFWLVDHDCFVLDLDELRRAEERSEGHAGAAFYGHRNSPTSIWKPQTFLMLLRPKMLRTIAERYGIRIAYPAQWSKLPALVKERLRHVGIDGNNLPESHKDYFDTLCLIACLAEADGVGWCAHRDYPAHFEPHPDVVHIGSTTILCFDPASTYQAFGAFFWQITVERWNAAALRAAYLKRSNLPMADEMKRHLLAYGIDANVIEQLESVGQ